MIYGTWNSVDRVFVARKFSTAEQWAQLKWFWSGIFFANWRPFVLIFCSFHLHVIRILMTTAYSGHLL